jgi:hypothetical protein
MRNFEAWGENPIDQAVKLVYLEPKKNRPPSVNSVNQERRRSAKYADVQRIHTMRRRVAGKLANLYAVSGWLLLSSRCGGGTKEQQDFSRA